MCNLSKGTAERAWAEGESIGEARGEKRVVTALKLLQDRLSLEKICEQTGLAMERLVELQALV